MPDPITARQLLSRAANLYDDEKAGFARTARIASRGGLEGSVVWMRRAMTKLRGSRVPRPDATRCGYLIITKYAIALLTAGAFALAAVATTESWLAVASFVPAFYVIECQMLFVLPRAIDGSARPMRDSRELVVRSGGTLAALQVLLPLAGCMLFGGVAGGGFLRSWCLGCLAVVMWYERLRAIAPRSIVAPTAEVA